MINVKEHKPVDIQDSIQRLDILMSCAKKFNTFGVDSDKLLNDWENVKAEINNS